MTEIKVPYETAQNDVARLLDRKNMFPSRRKALTGPIEAVVEAATLGFVAIAEDGTITQKLVQPVGNLTSLTYAPHVAAERMNKELADLRNVTPITVNLAYISMYTGQPTQVINKLEPTDRGIADAISFFFQ